MTQADTELYLILQSVRQSRTAWAETIILMTAINDRSITANLLISLSLSAGRTWTELPQL